MTGFVLLAARLTVLCAADGSEQHSIRAGGYLGLTTSITLAWTDPPGLPMAGLALVNNLDLVVKYKGD